MAGPAEAFEIALIIGTPIGFSDNVVDSRCRSQPVLTFALLAQVLITREDEWSELVPTGAISTLMP